jgi:Lon protease-like protein
MYTLPLFPLNIVLFPGLPIQLHIFEPRYRSMIRQCQADSQPFGVVLIHQGIEAYGPVAEPVRVGCTARIARLVPLEDGRMNLTALGEERFRILKLIHDHPYLVGEVESLPLERPSSIALLRGMRLLTPIVKDYLRLITKLNPQEPVDLSEVDFPEDPLLLLNLAATLLQVPAIEKQPLLESVSADDLMVEIFRLYRRENAVLRGSDGPAAGDAQKMAWLN